MNGFNKGVEMLYSPYATPITDGTAIRGLRLLRDDLGLPARLREIDGLERGHLPDVAQEIRDDGLVDAAPAGVNPTAGKIVEILERAW